MQRRNDKNKTMAGHIRQEEDRVNRRGRKRVKSAERAMDSHPNKDRKIHVRQPG